MNVQWKQLGERAKPRYWSGFVWSMLLFVILAAMGTAFVGFKLYQATGGDVGFSNR